MSAQELQVFTQPSYDDAQINFEFKTVTTSPTKAIASVGAKKNDHWKISPFDLHVIPDFNIRTKDAAYYARVRALADDMKENGFYTNKPIAVIGMVIDGETKTVVYGGHTRLDAVLLAISEGADIDRVPCVYAPQGTSMEMLTELAYKDNNGSPVDQYGMAITAKRFVNFGLSESEIAKKMSISISYVNNLLQIIAAPREIREMVQQGQVSTTEAADAIRKHGYDAIAILQGSLNQAKKAGKSKVTARFMPGKKLELFVKKSAPKMLESIQTVSQDPGFQNLTPETQDTILELIRNVELEKEKERIANSTDATNESSSENDNSDVTNETA